MSEAAAIECRGLTKIFSKKAVVDRLDLTVERGQVFAFLGENGAGKTTTIRMLVGLLRPQRGSIRVLGRPLGEKRLEILARTGALIEFPSYYGHLSGRQNLEIVRRLRDAQRVETDRVLELVGLAADARVRVRNYSQGMKQRLAIATALIGRPELVILDEPTNGLDPGGMREVRSLIGSIPEQQGGTVFVSSHLLAEVEQIASHVAIIQKGRLLFQGSLRSLAATQPFRVTIDSPTPERAVEILARAGYAAIRQDDAVEVLCDADATAKINRLLVEAGLDVRGLRTKHSLEELYFALTGKRGVKA